jgi:hypothetical protein
MINRYKRTARSFAELGLGALDPLDSAIPELQGEPGVNQKWKTSTILSVPNGIRTRVTALKGPCPGPG